MDRIVKILKLNIFSGIKGKIGLFAILIVFVSLIPIVFGASQNDACFSGICHSSSGPTIDRSLYDSNPHKIIKCIECHINSTSALDPDHGMFIRQLNGSKITGPLTTKYYSQNFSLCYSCHAEKNVVGILPTWIPSSNHVNLTPIIVSTIGTNFINVDPLGFHNGSQYGSGVDIPTNIHWNHLDAFGSINVGIFGQFDSNISGIKDSYASCPTCHNVHGTNYPKMTKNDLAIQYGVDANGSYGYINSMEYLYPGGDLYCGACHSSGVQTKYYRTEIKIFQDCISCHVDGAPGDVNRTAFSQGVHVNINTTGDTLVNNTDCWTCHFNRDMNRSNIRQCAYCHTGSAKPEAPGAPIIRTHVSGVKITNYSCADCHSKVIVDPGAGIPNVTSHYLKRPTISGEKYCDYCHGPNPSSPFNATNRTIPAFNHDKSDWNGNTTCRTCHSNSSVTADPLANDSTSFHDLTTELGDVYNGTARADCFICHVQSSPQFVTAPYPSHDITGYIAEDCRNCHTSGTGTEPQKLHSVSASATGGCIPCHSNNETRYYANTSLFGRHANINATGGPNNVTDDDCKTCHFGTADGTMKMKLGAANYSNTYFCDDCHVSGGRNPAGYANISSPYRKDSLQHGSTNCQWCHIAGALLPRPLDTTLRYHPSGPRGTAAGKDCLTCHSSNLPDLPFHAPGIVHSSDLDGCGYCHSQADNHAVSSLNANTPPSISGLSVTSVVTAGNVVQVQATVEDDMTQIAAAQYQVKKGITTVIDWTNMTPKDGRFDSSSELVNTSIDTSALLGTYTVNVKGMASAYKTIFALPYYPLNGQWSGIISAQFSVNEPTGYNNGTVSGRLYNGLAGAIVSTNTSVSTTTNETGFYSLSLANGTYRLTASKDPEYYSNSSVIVTVIARTNITTNIILDLKPKGNITGKVTNK